MEGVKRHGASLLVGNWALSMLLAVVMLVYDALESDSFPENGGYEREWISEEDIGRALLLPVLEAIAVANGVLGIRGRSPALLGAFCVVSGIAAALSFTWAAIWTVTQSWAFHTVL